MLLLREVNAVEHEAHVRQFLLCAQSVDHAEACLWSIVGTAHIYTEVSQTTELQTIIYQTHRSCIEDYVVVMFFQLVDDVVKTSSCYQLT